MRVAIFGGTGFVGGYIVEALLDAGHEPSLLVRAGSESKLRRAAMCRLIRGDLSSPEAIRDTVQDAGAVIYLVGILKEQPSRGVTFEELQYRGVVRVAEAAREAAVPRFLLMSANGVRPDGTPYQATKFRAEEHLRQSGLAWTIFRPSVIFGNPDGKMEIATQLRQQMVGPPLPGVAFRQGLTPGSDRIELSPVHVADVADAFVAALCDDESIGRTYTLGGPEVLTWDEMIERIAEAVGKRKLVVPMPLAMMKLAATLLDWLPFFPVTRDQLSMLADGNTAPPDELERLTNREARGFTPGNLGYLTANRVASEGANAA